MPFVDFAEIKRRVSIEEAANILNLTLKQSANQLRGVCPACGTDDNRTLALTPARGLFYCFSAKTGGDCIALVQHITGLSAPDAAAYLAPSGEAHNTPVPEPRKTAATKKEVAFDPVKFEAGLTYTDEVKALGYTEEFAKQMAIGSHRGAVYIPHRWPCGTIAGWVALTEGKLKVPKQWLPPAPTNVVKLRA